MTITPNRDDLAAYLDLVFGYVEADDTCIALRGIGEKGTDGEGEFRDIQIVPGIQGSFDVDRIFGHVQRWSLNGRASFIVPAAIDDVALTDKHATEDRIRFLTTVIADIDKGDTIGKLAHATKHLGRPSMVVHSGGTTETGHPKLHLYWRLTEASDQIERIASARKQLALKLGGDPSFGRSTQVIRIPGSIYGKGGVAKPCMIADKTGDEYELEDFLGFINEMPVAEGVVIDADKLQPAFAPLLYSSGGSGLNFSAYKNSNADKDNSEDIKRAFTTDIVEGGDADRNRWLEFSRVAGKNIASVRQGILSLDEARDHTATWMLEHMKPAWPAVRFESEWKGLLSHDIKTKGVIPGGGIAISHVPGHNGPVIEATINGVGNFSQQATLQEWSVSQWALSEKPKRKFLVQGLIMEGKSHMLAAEGGAGKTFLLLDLALKISTHAPDQKQIWCGLPLAEDAGGSVVMFTTEDDKDELHIRLQELDKDRCARAGDKLVIVPTINIGGAFPLVERERGTGTAQFSRAWTAWLDQLSKVKNLKLVVIDTLNTTLHGEENSATIINEYIQAASAIVCGRFGAALIVTHHVRKPGANVKIYTPEDMKNSIRGSTALIGAFRCTLGIWHAPDYKERLARMGRDTRTGVLYNFAVVKANNPEMAWGTRAMLRQPSGLLLDITDSEKQMIAATSGEVAAWLLHAVAHAAEQGHPFTIKSAMKKPPNGRKHQLPPMIQNMSERDISDLCKELLDTADGRLVLCNPKGKTTYNHLDIPGGPLAKAIGLDGGAYRTAEGGDFTAPDWEKKFAFHVAEGRIVERGQENARTTRAAQKTPASESQNPRGWNPNFDPILRTDRHPVAPQKNPVAPLFESGAATGATGLRFSPNTFLNSDT